MRPPEQVNDSTHVQRHFTVYENYQKCTMYFHKHCWSKSAFKVSLGANLANPRREYSQMTVSICISLHALDTSSITQLIRFHS